MADVEEELYPYGARAKKKRKKSRIDREDKELINWFFFQRPSKEKIRKETWAFGKKTIPFLSYSHIRQAHNGASFLIPCLAVTL